MALSKNTQSKAGLWLLFAGLLLLVYWFATYSAFKRADARHRQHIQQIIAADTNILDVYATPGERGNSFRRIFTWSLDVEHTVWNDLLLVLTGAIVFLALGAILYAPTASEQQRQSYLGSRLALGLFAGLLVAAISVVVAWSNTKEAEGLLWEQQLTRWHFGGLQSEIESYR